ncbi:synaptogenesis protein syg-2-like [Limulus polyphemus]|uniref:Synaptogenesis protein syg-2-like n=1 Tax=Limulus polyphemus TaxID=6850 RepID=A0ABM1SKS3_LIMPO|nr:synaptogenesis protein syg-2-like [Limulus polyphemus]
MWLVGGIVTVFALLLETESKQQYFQVKPSDTEVIEGLTAMLQCQIRNLAGAVQWSKDGFLLGFDPAIPGFKRYSMMVDKGEGIYNLRISNTTLEDEGKYQCQVGPAPNEGPIRARAELTVLVPPNQLTINGRSGHAILRIKEGERVNLTCSVHRSKPPSRLKWYRNGVEVIPDAAKTFVQKGNEKLKTVLSTLTLYPKMDDDEATYMCEADHSALAKPWTSSITISVLYPPEKVYLKGPVYARSGDVVTVVCTTSPSNPAVPITWLVDENPVSGGEQFNRNDSDGWITTSNLTVTLTRQDPDTKSFICRAGNPQIGITEGRKEIKVTYPPGQPTIVGNTEGVVMQTDYIQSFDCVSLGGNPHATLQWYRGNKQISTVSRVTGSGVSSTLVIKARREDNGAIYRCEATNLATLEPLVAFMKLSVRFPPRNASIVVQPAEPRAGEEILVRCSTDSSNPAARITWRKNKQEITGDQVEVEKANFGGYVTTSSLKQKVTSEDDGATFICLASNGVTERVARDECVISVRYKPEFLEPLKHVSVLEGESFAVNVSAIGNPNVITYYWFRGGVRVPAQEMTLTRKNGYIVIPRMRAEGPVLHVRETTRKDSGNYFCVAQNTEGSSNATVEFNVLYPAIILNLTENQRVTEGGNVILECWIEANPITHKTVIWNKHGSSKKLPSKSFLLGRSLLELLNVTREAAGKYECKAFNGIGQTDVMDVEVIVMYRPVILQPVIGKKVASRIGGGATINCTVDARPNVTFTWYLGNQLISWMSTKSNYQVDYQNNEKTVWTSVLHIRKVHSSTFGNYTCRAENYLGHSNITVELVRARVPKMPRKISASNITHNSVMFSWEPGLDGGLPQTFNIKWRETGQTKHYRSENTTFSKYLIRDLRPETDYEIFILAFNDAGISDSNEGGLKVHTKPAPTMDSTKAVTNGVESKKAQISRVVWMACAVCGAMVFVLIALIVMCCIRRHQRMRRCAEVALQLQRISQNEEHLKPLDNTDGHPFFLSGRTTERIVEEHGNTDNIQLAEYGMSWSNDSKSEENQNPRTSHLEEWGDEQIRKLGSCESLEEDDHCPDILKQYSRVCKDLTENVLFLAEKESTKDSCFTSSSEEVSKSLLHDFQVRNAKGGTETIPKYTEIGGFPDHQSCAYEPLLTSHIKDTQGIRS